MEEKKYVFKVTEQEANLVIQALAELPAKISMGLIAKLQNQFMDRIEEIDKKDE